MRAKIGHHKMGLTTHAAKKCFLLEMTCLCRHSAYSLPFISGGWGISDILEIANPHTCLMQMDNSAALAVITIVYGFEHLSEGLIRNYQKC